MLQVAVLLAAGQGGEEGGPRHAGPGGHRHQGRGGGVLLAELNNKYIIGIFLLRDKIIF